MLHLKLGHHLNIPTHEPTQMQSFQLRPLDHNSKLKAVQVDLSPINGISQLPKINGDSSFLPYLFFSPLEKARLESSGQKGETSTCAIFTEAFKVKLSEAKGERDHLKKVIFKPKPLTNYCQICKESYSDYEEHVGHEIHKKKVDQNQFSRHIEKLVKNFQIPQQKSLKRTRPLCQERMDSEGPFEIRTKKIIIEKSQFATVSMTKIESELKEDQLF